MTPTKIDWLHEPEAEIESDGRTVWVNSSSGMCIARFSRFGIDVHHDFEEQQRTGKECVHCTHSLPDAADWDTFKLKVKEAHGVEVSDDHMPDFIRRNK